MVLHLLSRYDEAERYLHAIDIQALPKDPKVISKYHRVCALVYASSGNAEMASDSFATALHYAEQDPDPYAYTSILHSHAMSASMLGRTELAGNLFLQALSAARDRNLGWNVACISLEYARVLSRRGNRHLAHAYVNQAATVENPPPVLLEALAEIGIPIAIECNDPYLLSQCANEDALTFAFRSGQPPRLGPVASSFARYFHRISQPQKARELLTESARVREERRRSLRSAACGRPIRRRALLWAGTRGPSKPNASTERRRGERALTLFRRPRFRPRGRRRRMYARSNGRCLVISKTPMDELRVGRDPAWSLRSSHP